VLCLCRQVKSILREHQAEFLHMPKWGTTNLASSMFRRFFFFCFLNLSYQSEETGKQGSPIATFCNKPNDVKKLPKKL
jgi:hypothetical protein